MSKKELYTRKNTEHCGNCEYNLTDDCSYFCKNCGCVVDEHGTTFKLRKTTSGRAIKSDADRLKGIDLERGVEKIDTDNSVDLYSTISHVSGSDQSE